METEIKDAPQKIQSLNARIEAYAKANKIPFVNYYQPMVVGENKALNPQYTKDGVHLQEKDMISWKHSLNRLLKKRLIIDRV